MATAAGVSFTIDASGAKTGASEIAAAIATIQRTLTELSGAAENAMKTVNAAFNLPSIKTAISQIEALNIALESVKMPNFSALTGELTTLSTKMSVVADSTKALNAELTAIGTGGGANLAGLSTELGTLQVKMTATADAGKVLNTELSAIGTGGGSNLAGITGELGALQAKMALTANEAKVLGTELAALGTGGAVALTTGIANAEAATGGLGKTMSENIPMVKGFLAILTGEGVLKLGEGIYEASNQFTRFSAIIHAVTDDTSVAAEEIGKINSGIVQWGLNSEKTQQSFSRFYASATEAKIPLTDVNNVFQEISKSMVVVGNTGEQQAHVWETLEQMLNRGTIASQQIKRQLAVELPGAINVFAESMGVSREKFFEMIKNNEVSSDRIVQFAKQYAEFVGKGLPEALDRADVGVARLTSAWTNMMAAIGTGGSGPMKALGKDLTDLANDMLVLQKDGTYATDSMTGLLQMSTKWQGIADNIGAALKSMFDAAKTVFMFIGDNAKLIADILEAYLAMKAVNAIMAVGRAFGGAISFVTDFGKAFVLIAPAVTSTAGAIAGLKFGVILDGALSAGKAILGFAFNGDIAAKAIGGLMTSMRGMIAINLGEIVTNIAASFVALGTASKSAAAGLRMIYEMEGLAGIITAIGTAISGGLMVALRGLIGLLAGVIASPIVIFFTGVQVVLWATGKTWADFWAGMRVVFDTAMGWIEKIPLLGDFVKYIRQELLGYNTAAEDAAKGNKTIGASADEATASVQKLSAAMEKEKTDQQAAGHTVTDQGNGTISVTSSVGDRKTEAAAQKTADQIASIENKANQHQAELDQKAAESAKAKYDKQEVAARHALDQEQIRRDQDAVKAAANSDKKALKAIEAEDRAAAAARTSSDKQQAASDKAADVAIKADEKRAKSFQATQDKIDKITEKAEQKAQKSAPAANTEIAVGGASTQSFADAIKNGNILKDAFHTAADEAKKLVAAGADVNKLSLGEADDAVDKMADLFKSKLIANMQASVPAGKEVSKSVAIEMQNAASGVDGFAAQVKKDLAAANGDATKTQQIIDRAFKAMASAAGDPSTKLTAFGNDLKKVKDYSDGFQTSLKADAASLDDVKAHAEGLKQPLVDANTAVTAMAAVVLDPLKQQMDSLKTAADSALKTGVTSAADSAKTGLTDLDKVDYSPAESAVDSMKTIIVLSLQAIIDKAKEAADALANVSPGGSSGGGAPGMQGRASGGMYAPGMVLVGEKGPEVIMTKEPGFVFTAEQTKRMPHRALGGPVQSGVATVVGEAGPEAVMSQMPPFTGYTRSGYQASADLSASANTKSDMAILPRPGSMVPAISEQDIAHYGKTYGETVINPSLRAGQVNPNQAALIQTIFKQVDADWIKYKKGGPSGQVGIAAASNGFYPYFEDVRKSEQLYPFLKSFVAAAFGSSFDGDISDPFGNAVTTAAATKAAADQAAFMATPPGAVYAFDKAEGTGAGAFFSSNFTSPDGMSNGPMNTPGASGILGGDVSGGLQSRKPLGKTDSTVKPYSDLLASGFYEYGLDTTVAFNPDNSTHIQWQGSAKPTYDDKTWKAGMAMVANGGPGLDPSIIKKLQMQEEQPISMGASIAQALGLSMGGYTVTNPKFQMNNDMVAQMIDGPTAHDIAEAQWLKAHLAQVAAEAKSTATALAQKNKDDNMASLNEWMNSQIATAKQNGSYDANWIANSKLIYQQQSDQINGIQHGGSHDVQWATGGEFDVGGTGGADSQVVRFRASPGEKVKISQPSNVHFGSDGPDSQGSSNGGGQPITIHINGVTDFNSFRRSEKQMLTRLQKAITKANAGT